MTESTTDTTELFCPECGYDIRHTSEARCPECGKAFDRAALAVSRIPWVHRHTLGRWRAWWRTIAMVLWRPGALGDEVSLPVDWKDASSFRRVNLWLATLLVAGVLGGLYRWLEFRGVVWQDWTAATEWSAPFFVLLTGPGLIVVAALAFLCGAAAVSWWVRLLFWQAGTLQRARASALSCYLSAWFLPLGMLFPIHVAVMVGIRPWNLHRLMSDFDSRWTVSLFLIDVAVILFIIIGGIAALRSSTRCGPFITLVATAAIPVGGAAAFAAAALVFAYALGMAAIIATSFMN